MIVSGPHVVDWVAKQTHPDGGFRGVGIGWEAGGQLRAGAVYERWNGVNIEVHIASDRSRKWLTRKALQFAFYYPFVQLGVRRMTAEIGEGNTACRKFAEHIGFVLESRKKAAHPTGDICVYVLFKDACRWIADPPLPHR